MEEAEILCDRIAIMEKGKILTMGETHKLIEQAKKPYSISFVAPKLPQQILEKIEKLGKLENIANKDGNYLLRLKTQKDLNDALGLIHEENPESLTVGRASLEDLFIELTGKRIGE
jgi:ABC-2 type transport system ATP-binding protein